MLLDILSFLRWGTSFTRRPSLTVCPLLGALALLLFVAVRPAAAGQNPRHILLLYESEKDLPMNRLIDRQLRATFREKLSDGVELYSEHIDVSRFPDRGHPRKALEFLHDKYRSRGLDLIVVVGAAALDPV